MLSHSPKQGKEESNLQLERLLGRRTSSGRLICGRRLLSIRGLPGKAFPAPSETHIPFLAR